MSKKYNNNIGNNDFSYMVIFAVVIFYGYFRNYVISRIGISGSAYLFTALDFIAIFIVLVPYALMHTLTGLIRSRLRANQKPNAKRIIYGGMVMAFILSVFSILFVYLFKGIIANNLLSKEYSTITLIILALSILPLSCTAVYKSFFKAAKYTGTLLIIELAEKVILISLAIIACKFSINYGTNISSVLLNREVLYAFGAIGCAAGIFIASVITAIGSCIIFKLFKSTLIDEYYSGRYDDIYDILSLINNDLIKISGPLACTIFALFLPMSLYIGSLKKTSSLSIVSYNAGLIYGPVLSLIVIPLLWILVINNTDKPLITKATKTNDLSELRIKALDMINYSLMVSIGAALFIEVCTTSLFEGLMLVSSAKAAFVARFSAPLIVFLSLSITFTAFLQGIKKPLSAVGNSLLSLIITILSAVVLTRVANLGLAGVLISLYIYSIILMLLNLKSLNKFLKHKTILRTSLIRIMIAGLISAAIIFALSFLLRLFLVPILVLVVDIVIFVVVDYLLLLKLSVINGHTITKYPFYGIFHWIGKLFHAL